MTLSRSPATQKIYDTRAATTLRRYQKETGWTWQDDPMRFSEWMLQQKGRWKRSTWRMTRLAVQERLRKEGAPVEAIEHFDDGKNVEIKAKGVFKAQRVRSFPDRDLRKLLNLLQNPSEQKGLRRGTYDDILSLFLRVNVRVGLRPSEWDTAQWARLDGETVLRVQNRKATNGRANGPERLLRIHPSFRRTVQALLDERDRFYLIGASWPEIQNGMANRLKEIRHLVTHKTYTLYSTRHRFVSAAKQSGFSKAEIADMLGHACEETAGEHYGRKNVKIGGHRREATESARHSRQISVTMGVGVPAETPLPSERPIEPERKTGRPSQG